MNKYIKLIFGISMSIAGLYYAFSGVDFNKLWNIIKQIDFFYGFISLFIILFSNVVRAL